MFSPLEEKVLRKLKTRKFWMLQDLTREIYKGAENPPMNQSSVISGVIIKINRKCEYHRLKWLVNGCGQGRAGRKIWYDKGV